MRLTKVETIEGRECVSCIFRGTPQCRIHNNILDCGHCELFAAILNQLHEFEEAYYETKEETRQED